MPAFVRVTHWLTTLCFFALLVTGVEIVISHPRFYWGETGNVNTPALFQIPIPASRASVPTGYDYVLPDQNGWSRALHFQAAWAVLFTGLWYLIAGLRGHLREHLFPRGFSIASLQHSLAEHLRLPSLAATPPGQYNLLQRLTYLFVIFGLFPFMIWTGIAMSPSFTAAFPFTVNLLGGHQSARTLHFVSTLALTVFVLIHILMIVLTGFRPRLRAMILGKATA